MKTVFQTQEAATMSDQWVFHWSDIMPIVRLPDTGAYLKPTFANLSSKQTDLCSIQDNLAQNFKFLNDNRNDLC